MTSKMTNFILVLFLFMTFCAFFFLFFPTWIVRLKIPTVFLGWLPCPLLHRTRRQPPCPVLHPDQKDKTGQGTTEVDEG
jgi:hypothetical protein